jgi:hypothetical protein
MSDNLRDFLNLEANQETHMFVRGLKKKTPQMRYDEFVKHTLPKFNELMVKYLKEEVEPKFKEAATIQKLEEIVIPALPDSIREEIVSYIDAQKSLNIVEKTYLCLDLLRAVSSQLGSTVGKMVMHYARALQMAPKIVGLDGQSL